MAKEMPNVVVAFREKGITAISRSERGIVATVRRRLGADIDAACGQLRKKQADGKEGDS